MLDEYSKDQLMLVAATYIGSLGGFPGPPQFFKDMARNELFRWTLVFILLYQGGAGQDVKLALMCTAMAYGAMMYLKSQERRGL